VCALLICKNLAGRIPAARRNLQINHAGRFAHVADPVAPSAVATFGRTPRELSRREINSVQKQFATAARRAQEAGFDLVELHGGTGYLLAQFVSPRTNQRIDSYGGSLENRMRFPMDKKSATGEGGRHRKMQPPVQCLYGTRHQRPAGLLHSMGPEDAQRSSRNVRVMGAGITQPWMA
jgi:hypothetical protein